MRKLKILLFLFATLLLPSRVFSVQNCPSNDPCSGINNPTQKEGCYTDVVNICASQRENMTSQVTYLSTKIELTKTKIEERKRKILELEDDIVDLSEKIFSLENSLTKITGLFLDRVKASYKYSNYSFLNVIFSSGKISELVNRYKYMQSVQTHDKKLLFQLQNSKVNYEDQKKTLEDKKNELNEAKTLLEKEEKTLEVQKKEKQVFLEVTKNSEKIYRDNLAAARKETQEIQKAASILSQAGVPERIDKGAVIGVMGNTGFSTGAHLHFAVYNLNESELNKFNFNSGYENPFNVLKSRSLPFEGTSCDDVPNVTTKNIGSGSWDWPMSNPTISQCYGHTPWSWRYQTGIHNGIDMYDDGNPLIKAVESGKKYTYRGGQSAGNGVFIFHDNGKMTLYWHLQ
jgi:peptidoglycan hydrolase CwlO-like protein